MAAQRGSAEQVESTPGKDPQVRVSQYWEHVVGSGRPYRYLMAHPWQLLRAVGDIRQLPRVDAVFSDGPAGQQMRGDLTRRTGLGLRLNATGVCVLDIPAVPADYSLGRSRQTLRRKVRSATKAGVTWREVTDLEEQRRLAAALDRHLPQKRDSRYRQVHSDHSYMVGSGLWTVAEGAEGTPLVVSVTPHDGEWAQLRLFIALGEEARHSDARYLLTQGVVEALSVRGVRHLFDGRSPHELTNGLRHFQRMLGFTVVRVRICGAPAEAGTPTVRSRSLEGRAREDVTLERAG
jgi:hypothetical protein